ncbi:MAG: hypothetical protein PW843_08745 [Azospirillaceae bacterium]|nr:hypothetical protein [Azospirillaceae bacterium]
MNPTVGQGDLQRRTPHVRHAIGLGHAAGVGQAHGGRQVGARLEPGDAEFGCQVRVHHQPGIGDPRHPLGMQGAAGVGGAGLLPVAFLHGQHVAGQRQENFALGLDTAAFVNLTPIPPAAHQPLRPSPS